MAIDPKKIKALVGGKPGGKFKVGDRVRFISGHSLEGVMGKDDGVHVVLALLPGSPPSVRLKDLRWGNQSGGTSTASESLLRKA